MGHLWGVPCLKPFTPPAQDARMGAPGTIEGWKVAGTPRAVPTNLLPLNTHDQPAARLGRSFALVLYIAVTVENGIITHKKLGLGATARCWNNPAGKLSQQKSKTVHGYLQTSNARGVRLSGISSEEHFVPESLAPLHFDLERLYHRLQASILLSSTAYSTGAS